VLLQDGILCTHLSGPLTLWCLLILVFVGFHLDDLSIHDRGVFQSPATSLLGSICVFKSSIRCLMKLGAPTLGISKLTIVVSSCCIAHFVSSD
jgi:hypothetical protein